MTRTDRDTWDLTSGVGATATLVAAARAAATRRLQPVINDPFAEPLVRAVGLDALTQLAAGELDENSVGFPRMVDLFAARARFFDEFFAETGKAGLRQVVIVASGLDARPYRLTWPTGTTVYEIDQPEVIEFKTTTLSELGAVPTAEHRPVGIDLRGDWPDALRRAGFEDSQPTAWLAEGVLIGYLPPEADVQLLDNITALSRAGSRLAADYGSVRAVQQAQDITGRWREHGLEFDIADVTYPGEQIDVTAHLQANGWDTTRSVFAELFATAGLAALEDDGNGPAASISFVRATLR